MDDVVFKNSVAERTYTVDFTDLLPSDTTITAASAVTAVDTTGAAVTSVLGTESESGMVLTVVLKAGTDGEDYTITFKGIGTTTGRIETFMLEMRVRNTLSGVV